MLIKERTGLNDLLRLQLQLEDAEIVFDNNLKEHYYATLKGKEKLKNRIKNKNNIFYVALNKDKIIVFIDGYVPDDELKKKIEFICSFCNTTPTIINGNIRKIDRTNLSYIEPHRIIIKGITFLAFNYSKTIYICNLSNKLEINELVI